MDPVVGGLLIVAFACCYPSESPGHGINYEGERMDRAEAEQVVDQMLTIPSNYGVISGGPAISPESLDRVRERFIAHVMKENE